MFVSILNRMSDYRSICLAGISSLLQNLLFLTLIVFFAITNDSTAANGLGSYGVEGKIHRHNLPSGIRDNVSDQSIALAQAPAFARARLLWSRQTPSSLVVAGEIDFVDQIDYQLSFRRNFDYLNANSSRIAKVLETKPENHGIQELGLYLSSAEVAEMERRNTIGAQATRVARLVNAFDSSNYATVWQDQLDGGKLVLAVKNKSALSRAQIRRLRRVVGSGNLKIVEQRYSERQQNRFKNRLVSALRDYGVGYIIETVTDANGAQALEIRTPNPEMLPRNFASDVPRGAYSLKRGNPPSLLGRPLQNHGWADLQPGIQITVFNSQTNVSRICSWGFNAHTQNFNYIVTAGHCFLSAGETISKRTSPWHLQVWHSTPYGWTKQLTDRRPFVKGTMENSDVLRVESRHANTNCYHGAGNTSSAHCRWAMESIAVHNSWTRGASRSCASLGNTNTYRCGSILDKNVPIGTRDRDGGITYIRAFRVQVGVMKGDSGAGFKNGNTIDGILTAGNDLDSYSYAISAYEVQSKLGVRFNCANGEQKKSPSEWEKCPSKNRR